MSYYGPQTKTRTAGGQKRQRRQHGQRPTSTQQQQQLNQQRQQQLRAWSRADHLNKHNKRLRKDVRQVPWRDEWELQAVGKALLSVLYPQKSQDHSNPQEQDIHEVHHSSQVMSIMEAFEMISVWKSRLNSTEGLPHAIESTEALALMYWRDLQRESLSSSASAVMTISIMELRLGYASAIVRCINGFADSLQQQRAMAASVSNLCGILGIPSWLVDIRHEAAHNALPSLEVLKLAASTLLEFLKT
jgi:ribosomal biogenesis protein LAS1